MSTTELLAAIETYCALHGMAESTFGRQAVNDGKLVARLRAGKTLTIPTFQRVEAFLARPVRQQASEAAA